MLWKCILLLSICLFNQQITGQDSQLANPNSNFWDQYEVVSTQRTSGSLSALDRCGEGKNKGVNICVPYYNCDGVTNFIKVDSATDGFGLIDIRAGENSCEHYLDTCCNIPPDGLPPNFNTTQPPPTRPPTTGGGGGGIRPPINGGGGGIRPPVNGGGGGGIVPPVNGGGGGGGVPPVNGGGGGGIVPPVTEPPFSGGGNEINNRGNNCGIRNKNGIDFTITGNMDNEAEFAEFPWMVAILKNDIDAQRSQAICGGSIITPNVILTGAHCVQTYKTNEIKIRAGEWDTQTTKERIPYQERGVVEIIYRNDFNPQNVFNDVALLILNEPLYKADNLGTICLPSQNEQVFSQSCYTMGWGRDRFGKEGQYSVILKKIELPIVARRPCEDALRTTRLGNYFKLHESFICAGGEEGKDACTGDGGGPLVCPDPNNPNRYIQVGIVAWGVGCGQHGIPGVYADVAKFRSWIDDELRRRNITPEPYTI